VGGMLNRITQQEFPKYIRYLKKSDLQFQDIEGLAFAPLAADYYAV
jgi:hypothetical protein